MRELRRVFSILAALSLSAGGCTTYRSPSAAQASFSNPGQGTGAASGPPYALSILEENNDGRRVMVHGSVTGRTSWDPGQVALGIRSFKDGKMVFDSSEPLRRFGVTQGPQLVPPDTAFQFIVAFPNEQASDYQLRLLWGKEASRFVQTLPERAVLKVANASYHAEERCESGVCTTHGYVKALLSNEGTAAVHSALVEVSFSHDAAAGGAGDEPARFRLNRLNLEPATVKAISIELERPLVQPESGTSGAEPPEVRVVARPL